MSLMSDTEKGLKHYIKERCESEVILEDVSPAQLQQTWSKSSSKMSSSRKLESSGRTDVDASHSSHAYFPSWKHRFGLSHGLEEAYEHMFKQEFSALRPPRNMLEKVVRHVWFESFFGMLIVLNSAVIALETEHDGIDIGFSLGVEKFDKNADEELPHVMDVVNILNVVFGVLFTIECAMKLTAFHWRFFKSSWNCFDLFLVAGWFLAEYVKLSFMTTNPMMFRLCRLARLVRLLRLIKWIEMMDALHILLTSIKMSFSILIWSCVILAVMITLVSLFTYDFVSSYLKDEDQPLEKRKAVFTYFGTFTRCTISFFEATLGNFSPVMRRLMENIHTAWAYFFMLYKCCGGFAVTSVILGTFLHETFRVAGSDDHLMVIREKRVEQAHLQKMTRLFIAADRSGTGALSYDEFFALITDPYIRTWLAAYELDVTDVKNLFYLIDDGDGRITAAELIAGVSRLKGTARSIDLHTTIHDTMQKFVELKCILTDVMELQAKFFCSTRFHATHDAFSAARHFSICAGGSRAENRRESPAK